MVDCIVLRDCLCTNPSWHACYTNKDLVCFLPPDLPLILNKWKMQNSVQAHCGEAEV